jgi:hypothetical protein
MFLWPLLLVLRLEWPWVVALELGHLLGMLWLPHSYLYLHRKAFLPLRRLLMPLVLLIAKLESIREKEATWYNSTDEFSRSEVILSQHDVKVLLASMKRSVRRDLTKKLRLFHDAGITTCTRHSDYLSLVTDVPIIWSHEHRKVAADESSSPLAEFIKRFLVMFLTSNAYIDRYYDRDGNLCALSLFSGVNEKIYLCFMYFCSQDHARSGIWQYNHLRGLLRAIVSGNYNYINFFVHQSFAKQLAGASPADYKDTELLHHLYPFGFFREPPEDVIELKLDLANVISCKRSKQQAQPTSNETSYDRRSS